MNTTSSIATPATPIYAVFSETGDSSPRSKDNLTVIPCPIVREISGPYTPPEVHPLIVVAPQGLEEPRGDNFLGFAESLSQAIGEFLPRPKTKPPEDESLDG
jgi:hypothetical protein